MVKTRERGSGLGERGDREGGKMRWMSGGREKGRERGREKEEKERVAQGKDRPE